MSERIEDIDKRLKMLEELHQVAYQVMGIFGIILILSYFNKD